ncbi:MAG: chlorophyll a/b-binding protein [Elainellaceae cyanobacterium]
MSTDSPETPDSLKTPPPAEGALPTEAPGSVTEPSPDVFALPERARQLEPGFGWSTYAEIMNGRFAMIGFIALLVIELVTHKDFFTWLGLR